MKKHKVLKIFIILIILCLMLPVISASIWDPFSLSKLKDLFVTYINWKKNVNGSGFELEVDNISITNIKEQIDGEGINILNDINLNENNINNVSNYTGIRINISENIISENSSVRGFFKGQPIDGSIISGVIYAEENKLKCGCLNATENETHVTYPVHKGRVWNLDNLDTNYCNLSGATIEPADDRHSVYYVDSSCTLQSDTWTNYFGRDINPSDYYRLFDVYKINGEIELVKGSSLIGILPRKIKWNSENCRAGATHLTICEGITIEEGTFPYFNQTSGSFIYVATKHTSAKKQTNVNGIHFVTYESGDLKHLNQTGMNLTHCTDGTDTAECSSPLYYRHYIYTIGFGIDNTRIHELAPRDDEYFTTLDNCMNFMKYPHTYIIPDLDTGVAVFHHVYCGRRGDTDWNDAGWYDLRDEKRVSGAGQDTSDFMRYSGWSQNADANDYNLTNVSLNAEDIDRDIPSDCPAGNKAYAWGDNFSVWYCSPDLFNTTDDIWKSISNQTWDSKIATLNETKLQNKTHANFTDLDVTGTTTLEKGLTVNADNTAQEHLTLEGYSTAPNARGGSIEWYYDGSNVGGYTYATSAGLHFGDVAQGGVGDLSNAYIGFATGDARFDGNLNVNTIVPDSGTLGITGILDVSTKIKAFPSIATGNVLQIILYATPTQAGKSFTGTINNIVVNANYDIKTMLGALYRIDMSSSYDSTITTTRAGDFLYTGDEDFTGTLNNAYGILIRGMNFGTTLPAGTVVNATGLRIEDVIGATGNNNAVETEFGNASFGDDVLIYGNRYLAGSEIALSPSITCDTNNVCYGIDFKTKTATFCEKNGEEWVCDKPNQAILNKLISIDNREILKAEFINSDRSCVNKTYNFVDWKSYQSGGRGCYYDEERAKRNCLDAVYNYWDNKTNTCEEDIVLKCLYNKTSDWNFITNKCEVNPILKCEAQEDMEWNIILGCIFSQEKQSQRIMQECLSSRLKSLNDCQIEAGIIFK